MLQITYTDATDIGVSLLPAAYKILSNILVSRLIPYINEINGDHQCGF
jgi:hypothetical protein